MKLFWVVKKAHSDHINDIVVIHQKNLVITCSNDNSIKLFNLRNGDKVFEMSKAHEDAVQSIIYNQATQFVYSAGLDKILNKWDLVEQIPETPIFTNRFEVLQESNNNNNNDTLNQQDSQNEDRIENENNMTEENLINPKNFILKKENSKLFFRINQMKVASLNKTKLFLLSVANHSISIYDTHTECLNKDFIQESQSIMTFCVNPSGSLLITNCCSLVQSFHLWLVDKNSFFNREILYGQSISSFPFAFSSGVFTDNEITSKNGFLANFRKSLMGGSEKDFTKYINSCNKTDPFKKSFDLEEFHKWVVLKEKEEYLEFKNEKRRALKFRINNEIDNSDEINFWFNLKNEKGILLNTYEGVKNSQVFMNCVFLDDFHFCSTTEEGFLLVWHINQKETILRQKVNDCVLNDVDVIQNNNQLMVAVGCDDFSVKIL